MSNAAIRLTQFSHGAGCGCKLSPQVLDVILKNNDTKIPFPGLLVGNDSRDDAAVMDLGNGNAMISTTDFFTPIVDDPYDFGRIAATNAISDIYAMGGTPSLAIAILGWPIDKIAPEIAAKVIEGARAVCADAGIPLAGGHSIDTPEPIFGLAVNGLVNTVHLKKNNGAQVGDFLYLTKPLGVGIISTASKKGIAKEEDVKLAVSYMTKLNKIGAALGKISGIHALTDVTGFGLFGHLIEMTVGSNLSVELDFSAIPLIPGIDQYLDQQCVPGGTYRNWNGYGHKISDCDARQLHIGCDPQTSGGLLVAIGEIDLMEFNKLLAQYELAELIEKPIGKMIAKSEKVIELKK